jgi:hypothetical protein
MSSTYELFAPDPTGESCQRLLPLNELKNTVSFLRVTTFNALVDLKPREDGGLRPGDLWPIHPGLTATLAVPLSAINIAYAEETRPAVVKIGNGHDLVAGLDGAFLPSDAAKALSERLNIGVLRVSDPRAVKPGIVNLDRAKVEIGRGTRKMMERYGSDYVRSAGSDTIVRLALDVEEVAVTDEKMLLEQRKILRGQQIRRVEIDDEGLRNLKMRRPALARIGNQFVRLRPPKTQPYVLPFPPFFDGKPAPKPKRPRYEIAILTTIEQDWKLLGYSRGALLKSITLAPREQLSIEVFTFDRLKTEKEQTFGTEFESNLEVNSLIRGSTAVASEVTQTLGVEGGLKGGASIQAVDVGGNVSVSDEVQTSLGLQTERINETTRNVSERFKATHQVRIVEARETGIETRSTRRLQNPNFSRTLTLNYFEILENYQVTTRVAGKKEKKEWCVLVENPAIAAFDIDTVLAYEHRLQQVLLSPNYRSGFAAARVLKAQQWFEDSQVRDELEKPSSTLTAQAPTTAGAPEPIPNRGVFATARSLHGLLLDDFLRLPDEIEGACDTLYEHYKPRLFEESQVSGDDLKDAEFTVKTYLFWLKFTFIYPDFEAKAEDYTNNVERLLSDNANQDEVLRQLALLVDGLDDGWVYAVKSVTFDIVVGMVVALLTVQAAEVLGPILIGLATGSDKGLPEMIDKARRQLRQVEQVQEQATVADVAAPSETDAAAEAPTGPPPVPQVFSLQDLAQANADFAALQLHLEKHKIFYQNEIWRVEDFNSRHERLKLMQLSRFVENRLLGFVGSKAIYPLRLSALSPDVAKTLQEKYANFREQDIKSFQSDVTLPTAGMHMESLLGQCEALEPYMQERRAVDLQARKAAAASAEAAALQQAEELKRLQLRLAQTPPQLDSPFETVRLPAPAGGDTEFDG